MSSRAQVVANSRTGLRWSLIQKIATPGLTLASTVLLARVLGPNKLGVYGVLQGTLWYVSLLSSLGLPLATQRFVPELWASGGQGAARSLVRKALWLKAGISAALYVVLLLALDPITGLLNIPASRLEFAVAVAGMLVFLESTILQAALNGIFEHKWVAAGQIVFAALRAAMLLLLLTTSGVSLAAVVLVDLAVYVASFLILVAGYVKSVRGFPRQPMGEDLRRRLRRYSGLSLLDQVGSTVFDYSTDIYVITYFLGPQAVSAYYLASEVTKYLGKLNVTAQFKTVIAPVFFSSAVGSEARQRYMHEIALKMSLVVLIPAAVGLVILAEEFLPLVFGAGYSDATPVIRMMSLIPIAHAFTISAEVVLQTGERVGVVLLSKGFALYNLVLSVLLIRPFGVAGVAFATVTAALLRAAFLTARAWKQHHGGLPWRHLIWMLVASAIMGASAWAVMVATSGVVAVVAAGTTGFLVYGSLMCMRTPFYRSEVQAFEQVLGRRLSLLHPSPDPVQL